MDETLIDDTNIADFLDQDLTGLKKLLQCNELSIDTTPEPLTPTYKNCKCGSILYESLKGEFRCNQCGCTLFRRD